MQFKNILKVASALFLAAPSLAYFSRDCDELNEKLVANVKKNLYEGEDINDFPPIQNVVNLPKLESPYDSIVNKFMDNNIRKDYGEEIIIDNKSVNYD
ncbi:hypothetical protein BCR32DRAFT_282376 [Anaeromyces robustus]|uniref:Uncharacterized protein n=1 Tax=Anaeromyces robustus TaxID=1754192 RepID=A0A1Y1WY03_9FUNG|nr:hypothetical protein BCR32DRAFT_282376 [Anaeromyces robustus]|eukprot:ORX78332.1 hypothetical protein BCR32DRAFT_282376 [Anaeromyces robustus]